MRRYCSDPKLQRSKVKVSGHHPVAFLKTSVKAATYHLRRRGDASYALWRRFQFRFALPNVAKSTDQDQCSWCAYDRTSCALLHSQIPFSRGLNLNHKLFYIVIPTSQLLFELWREFRSLLVSSRPTRIDSASSGTRKVNAHHLLISMGLSTQIFRPTFSYRGTRLSMQLQSWKSFFRAQGIFFSATLYDRTATAIIFMWETKSWYFYLGKSID